MLYAAYLKFHYENEGKRLGGLTEAIDLMYPELFFEKSRDIEDVGWCEQAGIV